MVRPRFRLNCIYTSEVIPLMLHEQERFSMAGVSSCASGRALTRSLPVPSAAPSASAAQPGL